MPDVVQASVPRESATIILVRSTPVEAWEVFLARRNSNQSFMAEAYVFPGGQVADPDKNEQLNARIATPGHFSPQTLLQDSSLTREMAQSLYICAIRETFEETGILIALTSAGHSLKLDSDRENARFATYRRELNAGRITLNDIARKENLFFPLDALIPYAHWITPEILPKRFSTRFFLAKLPDGQLTTTDCDELTDSLWAAPQEILHKHYQREIMLMPPTLKTLEELTAYVSIGALFAGARSRTLYPILPQPAESILKLPHDPEYSLEKYKVPARPDEPSRLVMTDGIWQTRHYQKP